MSDELRRLVAERPQLSAGIASADLADLATVLDELAEAGTRLAHVDVSDGRFGPSLTFGAPVVRAVRRPWLRDVHLMVEDPRSIITELVEAGADTITVQLETAGAIASLASLDPDRVTRGVAICPTTPLELVEPALAHVDLVLVLAVDPRHRETPRVESIEERLTAVRNLVGPDPLLGVDGGVTVEAARRYTTAGAQIVVAGGDLFRGDPRRTAGDFVAALGGSSANDGPRASQR